MPQPLFTNPDLAAIMSAISGMRTDLLDRIEKVNDRIDKVTAPQNVPDYMAWNEDNLPAWEHPRYTNANYNNTMEDIANANAARETAKLNKEHFYHSLMTRYVAEHRMYEPSDGVYMEKWYNVCDGIFKSMGWSHFRELSPAMDDTIINTWHCAEEILNKDEWKMSTSFIFEQLTGQKLSTHTDEGCKTFNQFTTAYNSFCTEQNFKVAEGFPETHDAFFKFYCKNLNTDIKPPCTQTGKMVRFTSAPPIETLPAAPSTPEDLPKLVAPTKAPISYASATFAFIPVT